MNSILLFGISTCALALGTPAPASVKIALPVIPGISRADIYVTRSPGNPAGTLILCPGHNGNGEGMADDREWSGFARKQNLNLVGLSFASNDDAPKRAYFLAETGSGEILLAGLKKAFGSRRVPLLFYGFSRGAQFTYTFARWKPELVIAWCAYSATAWENPKADMRAARGIIACGDEDEPNYSLAVDQFLRGRSLAEPWTWVSLAQWGHTPSASLEAFARTYFAAVLRNPTRKGLWLDVDNKMPITAADFERYPTLAAWLPDDDTAKAWKDLHQP